MRGELELFYAAPSPFVRKVCIVASELGCELKLTSASTSPVAPNREVIAANPLGKIPALRLPNGEILYDSAVICHYLGEGSSLYPEGHALWRALRRQALADGLIDAALLIRYEETLRPAPLRWDSWVDAQMGKIVGALDTMEADLAHTDGLDIGDIATGCATAYLDYRFPDLDWRSGHPRLRAHNETMSSRPSFEGTAPT